MRPPLAAIRLIDPRKERRNHFPELGENQVGVIARLGKRMRAHAKQQRFVRLAGAEQSHVRLHRRRQQPAQRVERLRANGRAVHAVAVGRIFRKPGAKMLLHRLEPSRVDLEGAIQRRLIPGLQRRAGEFGRHVVLPSAARAIGVRHVARRLLEIGHQTAPLEHLRQHVRDALAGEVHAAELRNRIVAVFREHLRVQLFRAGDADLALGRRPRRARSPRNSSRNNRRSDFAEREYREKSAPLTVSGRLVSAKTGPSRFEKYGASAARSSGVNSDTASEYTIQRLG